MPKSTKSPHPDKPEKPYPDFPLFPHDTRRWAKKIRGKFHYFGPWNNPQAALERFNREWPYLSQGRTPPPADTGDGCTVRDLCNAFLTSKQNKLAAGELSQRSFQEYYRACEQLVKFFRANRRVDDLHPNDFEAFRASLTKKWGIVRLKNEINRFRVVLKFAVDQRLIDQPVNFGQSFNRPSAKMLRKARNQAGPRLFEAHELRRILDALDGKPLDIEGLEKPLELKRDPMLKAMVLLALNSGFGNTDIASLPQSALDLDGGWIDFPRPKTEIHRRCPLWPETVVALRSAIAVRPEATEPSVAGLCFLTQQGRTWVRVQPNKTDPGKSTPLDALSPKFAKLLKRIKINGRPGLGFYTLRHVFETIAGESKDQVAVNAIMGHVDNSMAAVYRERISDERLRAVVDCVHGWLFAEPASSADAA